MHARALTDTDIETWFTLRSTLWPDCLAEDNAKDFQALKEHPESMAVFLAIDDRGKACGFVDAALRDVAESCDTRPVGYIEGIYVSPEFRGQGVGRLLAAAAERWAASRGCREMASDCLYDNEASVRFHRAIGYEVTGQLIHFRRDLPG
jgi:aminoglycoside 6'-N-acetyltransferase I